MASRSGVFSSSVGTKILIGASGLFLVGYLIIHIAGNLLIFFGPQVFNRYAYNMEVRNPTLPILEILILIGFLIHIFKTIRMYLANAAARPVSYVKKEGAGYTSRKSFASSTMIVSGLWLLLFLIIHVRVFRYGTEYPWPAGGRDLYRLEMETFANPIVVVFYVLSMIVVGSHLWHGITSALQSIGADSAAVTPRLLVVGKAIAVLIAVGFIAIAVWAYVTQAVHA
jgi:succinate dehydrogenase / fumarate reductase, cytochrome b subunit